MGQQASNPRTDINKSGIIIEFLTYECSWIKINPKKEVLDILSFRTDQWHLETTPERYWPGLEQLSSISCWRQHDGRCSFIFIWASKIIDLYSEKKNGGKYFSLFLYFKLVASSFFFVCISLSANNLIKDFLHAQ